ncbi:hypothetical protein EPD60_15415 [Flaviaesturariibacter flavus]|uniref:DUF4214 domain-containing protein n=1 Tax=Flaviaesturariibacter flavus TaxID=2502780 RepID=A0A4R1B3H9_9BACT|nr:hypothetical protein [Flaviaesturariibacter flavus]TCJ12652.1 hypothetical protein EPD60_15415 [Flaviaesturariibacter flavus]
MKKALLTKLTFCLLAIGSLFLMPATAQAQSRDEIIHASYFVAFGRYANAGELAYWRQNLGNRNIQQMVDNHKTYLRSTQSEREETVKRSFMDAFGWNPSSQELRQWSGQNKTYAEMMSYHINNWLNVYPDRKAHVIKQSYYKVFGRTANADELRYWMAQPTCSFAQLVAMHTTWKLQNQGSSKMGQIKPNMRENGISTAALSSGAMAGVVAAGGMNIIAPNGGQVVAAGGMNVVAPGGGN